MKNRAEVIFKLVDVICEPLQNSVHIDGITCVKDIKYGDMDIQSFDIYYKTEEENKLKPVIFYIHGGGFVMGGKRYRRSIAEILASLGYAVVNVDHRLAPQHVFPACIEDAVSAINFLLNVKDEYSLDLSKVVLCGDSSGGYIASFLAAAYSSEDIRNRLSLPDIAVKIIGLIGLSGVYDVKKMISMKFSLGIPQKVGESLMGMKLKRNLKNLSEYEYIDCISTLDLVNENWVPTLVVHAKKDLMCPKQGDVLLEKLRECGVPTSEHYAKKLLDNHCYILFNSRKESRNAIKSVEKFLADVVNNK